MPTTDTVVVGAGQAGLAVSWHLTGRGHDHVILERGRLGERWHSQRWDSLRLLTPNWMSGLPGWPYRGPDPDGFMTATDFAARLRCYARVSAAPVREHSAVRAVDAVDGAFVVSTDDERWTCRNVVIATGWCDHPALSGLATGLDQSIAQVASSGYRNPSLLSAGGVLVVGASATGVQLARELATAGRDVVLAVGSHTRIPRRYRGHDLYWWLAEVGSLDRTIDEVPEPVAARTEPSLQLIGDPAVGDLDLAVLAALGVQFAGRLVRLDGHRAEFADDLAGSVHAADARLRRVLSDLDVLADRWGIGRSEPPAPIGGLVALRALDLRRRGIRTVLWATGYRRRYPWLHLGVLDRHGEIRQRRGVTPVPGLYVLGQRFQHFRSSNFIHGVGRDAAFVADHLLRRPSDRASAWSASQGRRT